MRRWQHPDSPNTILSIFKTADDAPEWLLGTNAGLWRVRDGTPQQIAEPLKATMLTAVAAHSGRMLVGAADGIAYSDDDGESWTAGALPASPDQAQATVQVSQLVLSPNFAVDSIAFAATTSHGILRSTDRGTSWQYRKFGLSDSEVTAIALSPMYQFDGMTVAAVINGVFGSVLGEAWRLLPMESDAMPIAALAFARNALIAGSETHGLYHSTNRGVAWSKRSAFSSGPINALAISPDAAKIALATPQVVAWSDDAGETWMRAEGKTPKNIIAIGIANDGMLACGTQADGLWLY